MINPMRFKDKIVVVTGSTRGIGKTIALSFAKEGATSIIIGRDAETADKVRDEFTQQQLKAESFSADVTSTENVEEITNKILDKFNRIDILVNNAGITKDNLLLRMSENDWDEVIKVNLKSIFCCTKVIGKAMLKASAKGGKGKIINISSIIGILGNTGQANYATTKAGIIGFTKSIAKELASRGITVNAIAPGYIETDMTAQLKEDVREKILKDIPLARLGKPEDVAGICLFLASQEANYITGQTIVVDGGMAI